MAFRIHKQVFKIVFFFKPVLILATSFLDCEKRYLQNEQKIYRYILSPEK